MRSATFRISKNTAMLFLGTGCKMGLSFVFMLYIAALLGLEGFGKYSLAYYLFELFLSLSATAVGIYLTRELAKRTHRAPELLTHGLVMVCLLSLFSAGVMWLVGIALGYADDTRIAIVIASAALLPASIAVLAEAAFVAFERAEFVTYGTVLESVVRIVLSYALLASGYGLFSLFAVLIGTRLMLLMVYVVCLSRLNRLAWRFRRRRFMHFALRWRVFAAENWLATIYTNLDVLILSSFAGESAVGLYSAAGKLVRVGTVAAKSYTTAVFPVLSRLYLESRAQFDQLSRDSLRFMIALAVPAIVLVTLFAHQIIGLLFSPEYAAAAPLLQILIWIVLLQCWNPFLSHTLFAQGAQRRTMQIAALSLVINLVATLSLVARWGALGAAVGAVLAELVACCCYCLFSLRREDLVQLLLMAAKVSVASACLALMVFLVPNERWGLALMVGSVVYACVLFSLRAVTSADIQTLRMCFQSR